MLSNVRSIASHTIEVDVSSSYQHRSGFRLAQWRLRGLVGHNCASLLSIEVDDKLFISNSGPDEYLPVDFMVLKHAFLVPLPIANPFS